MKAKDTVMSDEELDAFCERAGLCSADWDEGGGFVREAVVRVILQAKTEVLEEIEKDFIWGQVKVLDLEKGDIELTMRCISDDDWQSRKSRSVSP